MIGLKKYSCIVIDDEPVAVRIVAGYLDRLGQIDLMGCFTDLRETEQFLKGNKTDLLFLDIEMPGINGIDFLKKQNLPAYVIFTTAYRNYAADAFDLDAVDYLLKPFSYERFCKAVDKFMETVSTKAGEQEFITVKSDKRYHNIAVKEILYIESMDDFIMIHTSGRNYICYMRLQALEELLDGQGFIRVHRSYIVNRRHLGSFTSSFVEVAGKKLPVGRKYRSSPNQDR
jgi:DNA-binding LytR/AlgR family response regulator